MNFVLVYVTFVALIIAGMSFLCAKYMRRIDQKRWNCFLSSFFRPVVAHPANLTSSLGHDLKFRIFYVPWIIFWMLLSEDFKGMIVSQMTKPRKLYFPEVGKILGQNSEYFKLRSI